MRYLVIVEKGASGYRAYVLDLPGCAVVAEPMEEGLQLIRETIELHIEGLGEADSPIPKTQSKVEYVQL